MKKIGGIVKVNSLFKYPRNHLHFYSFTFNQVENLPPNLSLYIQSNIETCRQISFTFNQNLYKIFFLGANFTHPDWWNAKLKFSKM